MNLSYSVAKIKFHRNYTAIVFKNILIHDTVLYTYLRCKSTKLITYSTIPSNSE